MRHVLLVMALGAALPLSLNAKPTIDELSVDAWPSVDFPQMSPDGSYAGYTIRKPSPRGDTYTIVIQNTHNGSKRQETAENSIGVNFAKNSRSAYWQDGDALKWMALDRGGPVHIERVKSLKWPPFAQGEWIAYQPADSPENLVVRNLVTGVARHIVAVSGYVFNSQGTALLVETRESDQREMPATLKWMDMASGGLVTLWSGTPISNFDSVRFDRSGLEVAFLVRRSGDAEENSLWIYRAGTRKAQMIIHAGDEGLKAGWPLSSFQFSRDGRRVFFMQQEPVAAGRKPAADAVPVNIWSYRDKVLHPQQLDQERPKIVVAAMSVAGGGMRSILEGELGVEEAFGLEDVSGDYVVVSKKEGDAAPGWPRLPTFSYWVVNLHDGTRKPLVTSTSFPVTDFSYSPNGMTVVYWSSERGGYCAYDTRTGRTREITTGLPPVSKEPANISNFDDNDRAQPVSAIAGWHHNGNYVLIYDRYDIWSVDPSGKRPPINITNGYGARNHIKLRFVYEKDPLTHGAAEYLETGRQLLTGFNPVNKDNGFFVKTMNKPGDPELLTMGPYTFDVLASQNGGFDDFSNGLTPIQSEMGSQRAWLVERQSATEYPNLLYTTNFKRFQELTELQPQKAYKWLTAELVTWRQFDGSESQGVLYKPEDFDQKKKYPVIFNYYEKRSNRLNEFPMPELTANNINIPWFVSRGYLVFTPDIYYTIANTPGGKTTGEAAYNSVVSAAEYLMKLPFVDGKRMGIEGHSFGGGETFSLVASSHIFSAACAAAGTVADEISAYLGLYRGADHPASEYRFYHAEMGHDRIGATLWERPDLYIRASPVFKANEVSTPLLIMQNQSDIAVDWGQSAEMYLALRRLGKKVWMLQYDGEGHSLQKKENAADFTVRLTQFFDYYLKGASPPTWMTEGVPARLKGIETGLELDTSGREP